PFPSPYNLRRPSYSFTKTDEGYFTFIKYRPSGGTFMPALPLFLLLIIFLKSVRENFPEPTSSSVPTMLLTIPLRNRLATMVKTIKSPFSFHFADLIVQTKWLTSVFTLLKHWKSWVPVSNAAAWFMVLRSAFL